MFAKIDKWRARASRRDIRLFYSVLTSVLGKFIAIGSTLVTIPLTLNYLGPEGFGVWMVISGVVAFMAFSDFGIGMGLQNALSKAYGLDDQVAPPFYIANSYLVLTGLAALLVALVVFLFSVLPVEALFKIEESKLLDEAVGALQFTLIAFFIGAPIALIQRILGGLQKTYIANNVLLVGSIISLLTILISVYFDLGLMWMAILFTLSPSIALLAYSFYFFYKKPLFLPRSSKLSRKYVAPIISAGAWTVLVQIIYTAKMNIPVLIISSSLGLIAVAEFTVAQKLTGLAAAVIGIALQPLWVVYGEAYFKGDRVWIVSTLKKSLKIVLLLTVPAALIFQFIGRDLINIWLGSDILPSQFLIACFSLWMILSTVNICFAMLLNGTGHFKNQAIFSSVLISSALISSFYFADNIGVNGIAFLLAFVAELACTPMYFLETRRIISGLDNEIK